MDLSESGAGGGGPAGGRGAGGGMVAGQAKSAMYEAFKQVGWENLRGVGSCRPCEGRGGGCRGEPR